MERPRLKRVFPPTPLNDRLIAIGGIDAGYAAEIEDDEHRHVWRLLSLLDGTRDLDAVCAEMLDSGAPVPRDEVVVAIASLVEAGYVEDAAASPPVGLLGVAEFERYRRNADPQVVWPEYVCGENNAHIRVGQESYYLSADGYLMPARKDQPAPDARYFKQTQK